jgi:cell division protein FtsW (lipid II flippase)
METFFVIAFIILVIIAIAKGTNKLIGPIGCLVLVIIFVVMTCEYDKEIKEEYNISDEEESKRKMDEAVEEIRKTKQMYIDSGWVKPPKL